MLTDWPAPFVDVVRGVVGDVQTTTQLYGLSQNRVWRVDGARHAVIVKASVDSAELRFYTQLRPQLGEHAINTPTLYGTHQTDTHCWIAIEYIPTSLPKSRWLADAEAMAQLRLLHAVTADVEGTGWFRPTWTDAMTEQALSHFDAAVREVILPKLAAIQQQAQSLFDPIALISGDPNPTNWGVRDFGAVVLFDWERVTQGHPALDLAITVPGLGSTNDFRRVAQTYLQSSNQEDINALAHKLALGKAWAVIDILSTVKQRANNPQVTLDHIRALFPSWLNALRV